MIRSQGHMIRPTGSHDLTQVTWLYQKVTWSDHGRSVWVHIFIHELEGWGFSKMGYKVASYCIFFTFVYYISNPLMQHESREAIPVVGSPRGYCSRWVHAFSPINWFHLYLTNMQHLFMFTVGQQVPLFHNTGHHNQHHMYYCCYVNMTSVSLLVN